jgi:hypothetical protein
VLLGFIPLALVVLALGVVGRAVLSSPDPAEAEPAIEASPTLVSSPESDHDVSAGTRPAASNPRSRWTRVLERLDRQRSVAWSQAAPRALSDVFSSGSDVLAADRSALARYTARGLTVDGVRLRFGRVAVESSRDGRVRLAVTDRLGPVAVRDDFGAVRALPRDRATAHIVVLVRTRAGWRISSVRSG